MELVETDRQLYQPDISISRTRVDRRDISSGPTASPIRRAVRVDRARYAAEFPRSHIDSAAESREAWSARRCPPDREALAMRTRQPNAPAMTGC